MLKQDRLIMGQLIGGKEGLCANSVNQITDKDSTVFQRSLADKKVDDQLRFRIDRRPDPMSSVFFFEVFIGKRFLFFTKAHNSSI